jgi:glyoxalase superfamily protein
VARLADIVFDCERPASLARWWASTLDGYHVAPYDSAELERLRDMGIFDPEDDPMVLVQAALGEGPRYLFQRVPEPKRHKNRVHLDLHLHSTDLEAEVTRLIGRGAVELYRIDTNVTMADPEGNEFCINTSAM